MKLPEEVDLGDGRKLVLIQEISTYRLINLPSQPVGTYRLVRPEDETPEDVNHLETAKKFLSKVPSLYNVETALKEVIKHLEVRP